MKFSKIILLVGLVHIIAAEFVPHRHTSTQQNEGSPQSGSSDDRRSTQHSSDNETGSYNEEKKEEKTGHTKTKGEELLEEHEILLLNAIEVSNYSLCSEIKSFLSEIKSNLISLEAKLKEAQKYGHFKLCETIQTKIAAFPKSSHKFKEMIEKEAKQLAEDDLIDKVDETGNTPLHNAIFRRDYERISLLIKYNADLNLLPNNSYTPFCLALWDIDIEYVKLMLESGARKHDVCSVGLEIYEKAVKGDTPLTQVARYGENDALLVLLNAGVDIDSTNMDGNTALYEAASTGKVETVKILLNLGADANIANLDGVTALSIAARNGNLECLHQLLMSNAEKDTSDKDGKTALDHAQRWNHESCVAYLQIYGAQNNVNIADYNPLSVLFNLMK